MHVCKTHWALPRGPCLCSNFAVAAGKPALNESKRPLRTQRALMTLAQAQSGPLSPAFLPTYLMRKAMAPGFLSRRPW